MTFILAFRQQMNLIGITYNQSLLLFSAPSLDLFFSVKSIINTVTLFTIDNLHW